MHALEATVHVEKPCVEHASSAVLAELVAQADAYWHRDSSPWEHTLEVLQLEDEVDDLESSGVAANGRFKLGT